MKPFTVYWILGTILTSAGTVLAFLGFSRIIPPEEPMWLIIVGLLCLGMGAMVLKEGKK